MEQHTAPPYRLTLKSNGCLILISALSPDYLVVASKHSLGTMTETDTGGTQDIEKLAKTLENLSVDKEKAANDAYSVDLADMQHAEVGREWLRRTLRKSKKTEAQLARRLWDGNLTAVFEVSFFLRPVRDHADEYSYATTRSRSTSSPRPLI